MTVQKPPQPDVQSAFLPPFFFPPSPFGMLRRAQRIGSVKMEERGRRTKVEFPVKLLSHVNHPASLSWHSQTSPTPALCLLVCVCVQCFSSLIIRILFWRLCVFWRNYRDDKTAEQMKEEINIWTGHTRWMASSIQMAPWRITPCVIFSPSPSLNSGLCNSEFRGKFLIRTFL